jgi:hypothetical protein
MTRAVSVISEDIRNGITANISAGIHPIGMGYGSAEGEIFVDDAHDNTIRRCTIPKGSSQEVSART